MPGATPDAGGWRGDFPLPTPIPGGGVFVTQLVDLRSGRRYPVKGAALSVGRDTGNDIMLDDATVSGRHAVFDCSGGRCVVHDEGSRNGVYVNGRRVAGSNLVKPGWQVQLGDVVLRAE